MQIICEGYIHSSAGLSHEMSWGHPDATDLVSSVTKLI